MQFLQAPDLRLRELLEGHVREYGSSPQSEGLPQDTGGAGSVAGIEQRAALRHPGDEHVGIHVIGGDRRHVRTS